MDRRERYSDLEEGLRIALEGQQGKLWTALPGTVVAFDPVRQTCNVQPVLSVNIRQQDGTFKPLNLPMLLDCPIQFASGGGVTLTFPIAVNDEVLVVFASRCIDSWWAQGGNITQGGLQPVQPELRMHDLSDGFVLPGIKSQPNKFTISTTAAQLRTNDGGAYLELNPTSKEIKVETSGNLTAIVAGNTSLTTTGTTLIKSTGAVTIESGASVEMKKTGLPTKGIVQGDCMCAFTGAPHPQVSATVKGSI